MIEQDYLLRQIKEFIAFMMKLLFRMEVPSAEDLIAEQQNSGDGAGVLYRMIDSGKIREAEALLYDSMQTKTADNLLKGYSFYSYLAQQEDDFLETNHYSRNQIAEGVRRLAALFDASHLANIFLPELEC